MKLLIFAASARKDSLNKKLAAQAAQLIKQINGEFEVVHPDFKQFEMPCYDGDFEEANEVPPGAVQLGELVAQADALIVSTPEYNGSIPGPLKNALDWLSRIEPMPLRRKPILLLSASPGALGGVRGLWHTRVPLEALGCVVFPDMFGLPRAHQAFDEQGALTDPKSSASMSKLISEFLASLAPR